MAYNELAPNIVSTASISWTPVLAFGGLSTGITYGTQAGTYNIVGNIVFFQMTIILTSKGSATGTATITGLPSGAAQATIFAISCRNITFVTMINARLPGGASTSINVDQYASAGLRTQLSDIAFANDSLLQISGSYMVN